MKLSEFMRSNGISPDALAGLMGDVSASAVRKWANEERIPRKDQIERIAKITGGLVMPNDFFSLPQPKRPAAGSPHDFDASIPAGVVAGPVRPSQAGTGAPFQKSQEMAE